MSDHKKCPFCGGTPKLKGGPILHDGGDLYWVHCGRCSVSQLGHGSKVDAWKAWDRRVKR